MAWACLSLSCGCLAIPLNCDIQVPTLFSLYNTKTFRFFATLLVIALCAGFTSCSDDDDENPLVGTWVSIENRNSVEYKDVMTINSDGTGSSAIYENGQIDKDGVDNFRYTYDENSKVFTWIWEEDSDGSDVYSMHVRELTGSKLVLVDDMDDEGEGEVITYTKQ